MKKQVIAVVAIIVTVGIMIGYAVWLAADNGCQVPKSSTKACYTPPIGLDVPVATCVGAEHNACSAQVFGELRVYDIKQFPDGTTSSPSGATHQPMRNCVRFHSCVWDEDANPPGCANSPQWSPWILQPKIEVNPDVNCPNS